MRKSSFRALLLALVIAIQALASGLGAAHATPGVAGAALAHCAHAAGATDIGADKAAGSDQSRRHAYCDVCCLCAPPGGVVASHIVAVVALERDSHVVAFAPGDAPAAPVRLSRRHSARGPPA